MRELDAQQPTLFHQKAGIKSRLNDIPRFCKEIMVAQQSGSAEDMAALSGLTLALQSIDWKNQYVWSYAWEAIEDVDVNLASEGNSYYDPGTMHFFCKQLQNIINSLASFKQVDTREISESHTQRQFARLQSVHSRSR
jgi:hypothetical protein